MTRSESGLVAAAQRHTGRDSCFLKKTRYRHVRFLVDLIKSWIAEYECPLAIFS